jgi:tRNA pseudouridine13 synthase
LNPLKPPGLFETPIGTAAFKTQLEDFQVEEVLGFEPAGEGEHCLLWIEKVDRNTNDVATEIAKRLGLRKRLVSHCGLKDRHAVTRQWFSLHLPGRESPEPKELESESVRVLKITRHLRKLHRGSHDANRFLIRLRDCNFSHSGCQQRWEQICRRGVPNYFGPQRFGFDGNNIVQSMQFMSGKIEVKDRLLRGILISAARSFVFNSVVAKRVADRNWDTLLDGEVFGFADNRSLVLPENLRGDEADRVKAGELELTAPLWGNGEPLSRSEVRRIEDDVVSEQNELVSGLAQFNLRQERRVIRLRPTEPTLEWSDNSESDTADSVVLRFQLPKGTYATTLLKELCELK